MENHSILKPPEKNHSTTEMNAKNNVSEHIQLLSYPIQRKINTTTNTTYQKLPPSGKYNIVFKII